MKKLLIIPLLFLTLFVSAQFTHSGGTFLKTGNSFQTATVAVEENDINDVLNDGYTAARWDGEESYFTKSSEVISDWAEMAESENNWHLTSSFSDLRPTWSAGGVIYTADANKNTSAAVSQPYTIYVVMEYTTFSAGLRLITFDNSNTTQLIIHNVGAPHEIILYAGTGNAHVVLPENTWGIIRMVIDGANSKLQVDDHTAHTLDAGSAATTKIEFGDGTANFVIREIIFRSKADSEADQTIVVNYLNTTYSVF